MGPSRPSFCSRGAPNHDHATSLLLCPAHSAAQKILGSANDTRKRVLQDPDARGSAFVGLREGRFLSPVTTRRAPVNEAHNNGLEGAQLLRMLLVLQVPRDLREHLFARYAPQHCYGRA
jgi:hypothetical protein